jgi:hypothetical protein
VTKIRIRIIALISGIVLAVAGLISSAVPASASGCSVKVTVTGTSVTGKRTSGSCRFEVYGHFNVPGQNGKYVAGADATTGYSVAYDSGYPRTGSYGWKLS